jgi:hypothetical protein
MDFITDNVKNIIKKGIDELYINLNIRDKQILYKYVIKLIHFISLQYNFKGTEYEYQLIQNDYKDIKWLSTLLLPFLNKSQTLLKSFDDMYKKKYNQNCDINKEEPIYEFTNIEYSRCNRKNDDNNIIAEEIEFDEEHIKQNFILLLRSLILCSHKLYINWLNIIPYTTIDFMTSDLYINTTELYNKQNIKEIDLLEFTNKNEQTDETKQLINSLYIGDIYNTLRVYLYEEIKNIKLLIFDLVIKDINLKSVALPILNEYFYNFDNDIYILNLALQNIGWDNINKSNQNVFTKRIDNLFDKFLSEDELYINNPDKDSPDAFYIISKISMKRLVRGILINFDNKYKYKKQIIDSGYIPIKNISNNNDDDDDDEDNYGGNKYDFSNIEQTVKSIKSEYIYTFLKDILQEFKNTYYSSILLDVEKKNIVENIVEKDNLSIKNIYNFAKSLSHHEVNKKYIPFNRNWVSLTDNEKKIILNRLNDRIKDPMEWFNMGGYISSLIDAGYILPLYKKNLNRKEIIKEYNIKLYKEIREKIIKIVFEILINKGILSRFVINRQLTDKSVIPSNIRLTDYVAEKLKNIYFNNDNYTLYANYYLTNLPYIHSGYYISQVSKNGWYAMDPMEWVSQLGFCHHYIHNRVSYVSGATGVGKSTHVPKLFLYYLKAIDYKSSGTVACTQPRQTPTENNADTVSSQMGIPVKPKKEKNETEEYYYVQMEHKNNKHVKNNKHLILKFITDGTLLQQFKELPPVFKRTQKNKNNLYITPDNMYDIVIIDEAHEHNKNMDILLTVMKTFAYHNPSIRLVILSATLDEDESNYRRYYRVINDNLKYPYDLFIKKSELDRINIDRRYHISPPGAGTRFVVNEFYEENVNKENLNEITINLIKKLIKTQKGDILVFQPGEGDIIKLIEELNKIIDPDWIALPFYSNLKQNKKNFIEKIDETFDKLRMDREQNFNDCPNIFEGNKRYNHFILVATNIAEASITINRLYYVIDTGTRKSNNYDYKRRNNNLLTTIISETSRVQRKGRVGRTGPGDAHFLYKKGTTTNNKTPYSISIENIGTDLYTLIRKSTNDKKFDRTQYPQLILMYETGEGEFNYIGNPSQNNYDFKDYLPEYYGVGIGSGYSVEDIKDDYGRFHIIHPDELNLSRNIYGRIISVKTEDIQVTDKKNGKIKSDKVDSFFEDYETTKFMENFNKTELGLNISRMISKLELDSDAYAKMLIYGLLLTEHTSEEYNNLIIGVCILSIINNDINRICKKDTLNNAIIKTILSNNKDSDIGVLIDKMKQILEYINFSKFNFESDILNGEIQFEKVGNIDREKLKDIYMNHVDYEDTDIERGDLINKIAENITKKIDKKRIKFICEKLELNFDEDSDSNIVSKFVDTYIKMRENINHLFYPDKRDENFSSFINKYRKIYFNNNYNHYDLIKLTCILSQPYNLCLNINFTNGYLSLYNPIPENIINIGIIRTIDEKENKKKYIKSTFINDRFIREYVFYINYDSLKDNMNIICRFDIKMLKDLKLFTNIYNINRLKNITQKYSIKIDKFIKKLKEEEKLKLNLSKDYDKIIGTGKAFNKLLMDLS